MRKEVVTLISDLSGVDAHETVSFALDGAEYEIELTSSEAADLRAATQRFVTVARQVGKQREGLSTRRAFRTVLPSAPSTKAERDTIRTWALSNGYEVKGKARIPAAVVEAYHAARTRG